MAARIAVTAAASGIGLAIARAFVNSRVQTIYGGTTEIQKEIIGRSLGL